MTKLTFNNKPLPDFVKVTAVTFSTLGANEIIEATSARQVGNRFSRMKRGGATCTVTLLLDTHGSQWNIMQMKDELKRWARGDKWRPSRLVFDKTADRYNLAVITNSVDIEDLFEYATTELEFYMADPLAYATTDTSVAPLNGVLTVDYTGNEDAKPVFTFVLNAQTTKITIKKVGSNEALTLTGTMAAGDTIEVDCMNKRIKKNGLNYIGAMTLESDWLVIGVDEVTTFKITGATNASMRYRTAY